MQKAYLKERKDFKMLEKASQNIYSLQNKSLKDAFNW